MSAARRKGPVMPVKTALPMSGWVIAGFLFLFALAVGNVYVGVLRVKYGKEIQELRQDVSYLGSEVRDLRGQKASLTSLVSIEQRAMEMGMIYPRKLPRKLEVAVEAGEVPLGWISSSTKRIAPDEKRSANRIAMAGGR